MRIVFISNFLNHHQLPLMRSLQKYFDEVRFISTEKIPIDRLKLGYDEMSQYEFVIDATDILNLQEAMTICSEFEIAMIGSAPDSFIHQRLKQNKITFRYMERIFKQSDLLALHPNMIRSILMNHTKYNNKPLYLLCAGFKVKRDFSIYRAYKNKSFKWGYFPEFIEYSKNLMIRPINNKTLKIIWIGRFIKWKHPEKMIKVAKYLMKKNIRFKITMIGIGPLLTSVKNRIQIAGLDEYFIINGSMNHSEIRNYLLKSDIFMFTSDRNEGWGAVLNEAMNAACAVIANKYIGSTGYLVEHGVNGLLYKNDSEMLKNISYLIENPLKRNELGLKAYDTIANVWNSDVAANHLYLLSKSLLENNPIVLFGPGSNA